MYSHCVYSPPTYYGDPACDPDDPTGDPWEVHVTCGLKSNRKLNGLRLDQLASIFLPPHNMAPAALVACLNCELAAADFWAEREPRSAIYFLLDVAMLIRPRTPIPAAPAV